MRLGIFYTKYKIYLKIYYTIMLYEANDMRMRMMMMMMLMMMLMIYCQLFHVAIQEIFAERVSRWVVCVLIAQRTTGMQSYPAQESNQSDSDQMRLLKPAILHTHHLLFFIIFIIHPPSPPKNNKIKYNVDHAFNIIH